MGQGDQEHHGAPMSAYEARQYKDGCALVPFELTHIAQVRILGHSACSASTSIGLGEKSSRSQPKSPEYELVTEDGVKLAGDEVTNCQGACETARTAAICSATTSLSPLGSSEIQKSFTIYHCSH